MKTTSISDNRCIIMYTDPITDEPYKLELFAPATGGYVKIDDARQYPQICEGLAGMGNTLMWHPRSGPLADTIRREYRRMVSHARREMARR